MRVQGIITLILSLAAYSAMAGNMTPPGIPSAGSGMPTTKAIFQQLSSGTKAEPISGFQGPSAGPGSSGRSLKEIAGKLPVADNVNGLKPNEAPAGKTFWSLRNDGTWGGQIGTNAYCKENVLGSWVNCVSKICVDSVCRTATCTDLVTNGNETDVDCGGPACSKCGLGKSCTSVTDCTTGNCKGSVCTSLICGDGIKEGIEQCDDSNFTSGDGCSSTCSVEVGYVCTGQGASSCHTACGDGIRAGSEQCDDGNTTNGDGCSATCQVEPITETELNGTCATANGPFTIPPGSFGMILSGTLSPGTDQDWFSFTTTAYSDLSFQTFDQVSLATCASPLDTVIQLYKSDCTTQQSISQDQGGIANCSKLDSTTQAAAMKHVPPGTYMLRVKPFITTTLGSYFLQAKITALCGNSVIEGSEECDGGPACGADCMIIPVCGDGVVSGTEQCDDGNTANGDSCSSTCQWETVAEVDPNDTTANADTNAVNNLLLLIDGNRNILGGISSGTDKDIFKMVVSANNTVVHLKTFDSSGSDCRTAAPYNMAGHNLRILNSSGTTLVSDYESSSASGYTSVNTNQAGIGVCAALTYRLDAGTYYIQIDKTAALAAYFLQVRFMTDNGNEVEPNDIQSTATTDPGRMTQIFGDHMTSTDTDWYSITIPSGGASVRAEIIEGDTSETCESNGIDSALALYNAAGALLGSDSGTDTGRGYCSLIDGTGSTPANAFAHVLAAGTYYLKVTSFGTSASAANQFNYRLAVTVR